MGWVVDRVEAALDRIETSERPEAWITVVPREVARAAALDVERRLAVGEDLPLAGRTVAVKDNIDVAGLPTTAACPPFATTPERSAPTVAALEAAGAVVLGKTNLDQFATGLVGTRSPYGVVRNVVDPSRVSGGSSSGSGVAVALGEVDLALGTDTAGSGRVPAAFGGVVGCKPTVGLVSTRGVVPACASFDCVSVFARTVGEAIEALDVLAGFDPDDPSSRPAPTEVPGPCDADVPGGPTAADPAAITRVGIPRDDQLDLAPDARRSFLAIVEGLRAAGVAVVEIDWAPFDQAGSLLYGGGFVAERYAAVGAFIEAHPDEVDPTVARIVLAARELPAHRLAADIVELRRLRRIVEGLFRPTPTDPDTDSGIDAVLVPTAPFVPTIDEVAADPIGVNTTLGRYTAPANLLDLCALAFPAERTDDGLPFGVMLYGPAFADRAVAALAARVLGEPALPPTRSPAGPPAAEPTDAPSIGGNGASSVDGHGAGNAAGAVAARTPGPTTEPGPTAGAGPTADAGPRLLLAVAGAHLAGQPLNHQLTDRGGRLESLTATSPDYRLYALDTIPPKPGLVWVGDGGSAIEVEVWSLPAAGFASFVAEVPPPLAIGSVELADGSRVTGFTCMPHALDDALDITAGGGWRAHLATRA